MDVIEGSELQIADAVYAYQLDGKGGVTGVFGQIRARS